MRNIRRVLDRVAEGALDEVVGRRDAFGRGFSRATALALASVPAGLALLARPERARAQSDQAVVDVLNFALTLEYLEAEFYTMGVAASGLVPAGDADVFTTIRDHENAHVALLKGALGSAAVSKPTFDFTAGGAFADVFTSYPTFLAVSQAFEDTGVRAYKGQAGALIGADAVLTIALQIHSVEARHASIVRRIRGQEGWIQGAATDVPAIAAVYAGEANTTHAGLNAATVTSIGTAELTEAFDEPLTMAQVLAIADPFIVS